MSAVPRVSAARRRPFRRAAIEAVEDRFGRVGRGAISPSADMRRRVGRHAWQRRRVVGSVVETRARSTREGTIGRAWRCRCRPLAFIVMALARQEMAREAKVKKAKPPKN